MSNAASDFFKDQFDPGWREREAAMKAFYDSLPSSNGGPMTDENCGQRISDMLMECAERLGNFPRAKVDPRAWGHLLVYAPRDDQTHE